MTASTPRLVRAAVVLALAAVTLGALATAAPAAKSCEQQVIDDWYDNGRVDKQVYDAKCYRGAIRSLPTDVLDYSSAKNDILRALAFAQRGQPDPGKTPGTAPTTPDPTTEQPTTPDTTPATTVEDPPLSSAPETETEITAAAPEGESASSVPIPLIVLGGLAILLFAAGVAGYLTRRFRGGDEPPLGA
jgi:hypothetical protein